MSEPELLMTGDEGAEAYHMLASAIEVSSHVRGAAWRHV